MSAKRQATSDLNHDNWDRDEEPEMRGSFQTATEEELKNRVIKKARRKIAASDAADGSGSSASANKSVFSGFAGFGKVTSTTSGSAASSPFSFLAKIPSSIATSSSSTATSTTSNNPTFIFGGNATKESTTTDVGSKSDVKTSPIASNTSKAATAKPSEKSTIYYAKLKDLNQTVSDWIKSHVDKNPLCILTPIFKDYDNFLKEIEKENEQSSTSITSTAVFNATTFSAAPSTTATSNTFSNFKFSPSSSTPATSAKFSFGISAPAKTESITTSTTASSSIFGNTSKPNISDAPKTNGFSFGLKSDDKKSPSASSTGFSFGKLYKPPSTDDSDSKKSSGFSFASSVTAPFSFGNIQPPTATPTSTANAEEDEEDQPPKVEFKQVVEDGAVFSKKCKVFVKKDGNFADRGVGTLYLKPIKDSEKTQLLVRADTNLGNILVNLILNAAIPTQRMGKNNVMLVCHPTPDVDKPTSLLLRVKTSDEADELLETINKYKK